MASKTFGQRESLKDACYSDVSYSCEISYSDLISENLISGACNTEVDGTLPEVDGNASSSLCCRRAMFAASTTMVALLLVGVGVAITPQLQHRSPRWRPGNHTLQGWSDEPNIDELIKHAISGEDFDEQLEEIPPSTTKLGYDVDELPWMRVQCVVDVVQATSFLGTAVVFLYKAIDYDGFQCPANTPEGCAVAVAGFGASISWVASYLSLAASSCADAKNSGTLCASDWTAILGNLGQLASASAGVKQDCSFSSDLSSLGKIMHKTHQQFEKGHLPMLQRVYSGPLRHSRQTWRGHLPKVIHITDQEGSARTERNFDIAQCHFDVVLAASYLVRSITQIRTAATSCDEAKACAMSVLSIISSFAWISQYIAFAISDCPVSSDISKAACAASLSDLVASSANAAASGMAATTDCPDAEAAAAEATTSTSAEDFSTTAEDEEEDEEQKNEEDEVEERDSNTTASMSKAIAWEAEEEGRMEHSKSKAAQIAMGVTNNFSANSTLQMESQPT